MRIPVLKDCTAPDCNLVARYAALRSRLSVVEAENARLRAEREKYTIGADTIVSRVLPSMTIGGMSVAVDPDVPRNQVWIEQDGEIVAKIVNVVGAPPSGSPPNGET